MLIFSTLILVSAVLYIYYKVSITRSNDPLTQLYLNGRAKICLGSFVFFFGINQYLFYETKLSLFIGIVFLVLGGMQMTNGYKSSQHYRNEYRKHHTTMES
ncbi:YtpI family protein [Thalassobacillus pellis]|uniref:YtpI family protein n=1 Tax=Thalassobacillus pellis TaxID=748008 RepID=UPI001960E1D5|nr:YtpI family protein [Thalassobacillus pellis]MBM7554973.1 multisubunit Na+/H+ antiporter MnhG subunit [Thalassobacillus pellis]